MVSNLVKNHHDAMLEHQSVTVIFTTDRGVTHEAVRHRIASFAQESTRYVNYSNDKFGNEITVLNIENGIKRDKKMKNLSQETVSQIIAEWHSAMEDAERHYMRMIELGSSPQIARSVLPHSTKATLVVTMNYRSWRHFFELRTPGDAHPQIRDIAIPLLAEFKKKIQIIFDDIEVKE